MVEFWDDYQPWIIGLGIMVGALIATAIFHKFAFYIVARITRRTPSIIDDSVVRRSRAPTRIIALLIAFSVFLPGLPIGADTRAVLHRIAALGLTAAIGWLVIKATGVVLDYVQARFDTNNLDNLRARQVWTQTLLLHRFAVGIIGILTVCIMLMSIPGIRQIGVSLFASAGVAGLVIGMAAQQVLKNVLAGIQLALTDPVRVEDIVIVEGEWGRVEEIRSTYIVVKIWDLRRLIVPLSYFIEQPFQNWTRRTTDLLGTVFWYVDYTVPVERMRKQLETIVKDDPLWDGNVCVLQVTDVKENTIEIRGLISASNSGNTFDLRCHVRERMIEWLQREYPGSLPRVRAEIHGDGVAPELHDPKPLEARNRLS